MKIGIIGPKDSIDNILEIKEEFSKEISFNIYIAQTQQEVRDQIKKCQEESDGILFTGPTVYDYIVDYIKLKKSFTFIPYDESSLYSFLLKEKKLKMKLPSIDVIEEKIVKETFKNYEVEKYYVASHISKKIETDYILFHEENIKNNKVDTILTTFTPIYDYFKNKKFPVYRIHTTLFSVRNSINSLINEIKNQEINFSKIAIQVIKLSFEEKRINKFSLLEKSLDFQKKIIPYLEIIQGSIFHNNWDEFIIFSNKGFLISEEAKVEFNKILYKNKFKISSGVGLGKTASEAESNAYEGLKYSMTQKESSFFICDENKKIITPLIEDEENINLNEIYLYEKDRSNIEDEELSIGYINKIKNIMKLYKVDTFSSETLASYLGISNKSARRILKKLIDSENAEVVGKEAKHSSGRPQSMIKINLNLNKKTKEN